MNNVVDMFTKLVKGQPEVEVDPEVPLTDEAIASFQQLVEEMVDAQVNPAYFIEKMREVSNEVSAWPDV